MSTPPEHSPGWRENADKTAFDWARETGEVEHVIGDLDKLIAQRRRRRAGLSLGAAALFAVAAVTVLQLRQPADDTAMPAVASINVLRPEARTLPDGSRIELRAGAELKVEFSPTVRKIVLQRGQAHFEVQKDPARPFVVATPALSVRAVGTAFAVDLGAAAVDVLVTEGRVALQENAAAAVDEPPALALVGHGHRARVSLDLAGRIAAHEVQSILERDAQEQLAWRIPRLEFSDTPLADVVAMFNRHGNTELVIAHASLRSQQLSGVLRADDIDSLVRLLEREFRIVSERRGSQILLRR